MAIISIMDVLTSLSAAGIGKSRTLLDDIPVEKALARDAFTLKKWKGNAMAKKARDIEKGYPTSAFVAKLWRSADALERGESFRIQIANERIFVPARAIFDIEHERESGQEEIEFQIKWTVND